MTATEALRAFLIPLLPGWRIQFGRWIDESKADRYAVIKPSGGMGGDLVRRPGYSLILIGGSGDIDQVPHQAAEQIIQASRVSSGELVYIQAGEPVHWATDDGRPVAEIAITTIN